MPRATVIPFYALRLRPARRADQEDRATFRDLAFDLHRTILVASGDYRRTPTPEVGKERPLARRTSERSRGCARRLVLRVGDQWIVMLAIAMTGSSGMSKGVADYSIARTLCRVVPIAATLTPSTL
jgi:hypothetical protein